MNRYTVTHTNPGIVNPIVILGDHLLHLHVQLEVRHVGFNNVTDIHIDHNIDPIDPEIETFG